MATRTVFRFDSRPPEEIFGNGFTPKGTSTDLEDYVSTNNPSGFVSTTKSPSVALNWKTEGYVYGIAKPGGIDVNATLGAASPYAEEEEIAFAGGIEDQYVIGAIRVELGEYTHDLFYNPGFRG